MALFSPAPKTPGPCRYLQATRRQNHQCRKDFGLPEAIKEARRLAVYRETAFIHSIVAAALTYSIARACSEGKMTKCHCGKEKYPPNVKTSWMWGGCSDNGKHGKRMAKRFLDLHPSDGDQVSEILRHNSEVGILSAISTINEKCKCHGVSGSCSMKTCWRKLADFNTTASLLKVKYHEAIRKFPSNKSSRRSVPDWYFKKKSQREETASIRKIVRCYVVDEDTRRIWYKNESNVDVDSKRGNVVTLYAIIARASKNDIFNQLAVNMLKSLFDTSVPIAPGQFNNIPDVDDVNIISAQDRLNLVFFLNGLNEKFNVEIPVVPEPILNS
ncbi:hypothetical protein HA402_002833 [Bradysia odoriphaga]|nr:hypothetical protein HA402_002833 [Bradysia odoriphaga]